MALWRAAISARRALPGRCGAPLRGGAGTAGHDLLPEDGRHDRLVETLEGGVNAGGATFGNPAPATPCSAPAISSANWQGGLLRNTDGTYALWQTNGASIIGGGNIGNPGGTWQFAGIGDFNGDGVSDILFTDGSGNYATWDLHGTSIIGGGNIGNPGAGWTLAGVGDFNGDGTSDLLFQKGGTYATWDVGDNQITGGGTIGSPGGSWVLKGTGDFNGDGKSDMLFEDASGNYATWDIGGSSIIGTDGIGNPGAGWQFAGIADIFSAIIDTILFTNTTTHAYATWDVTDATIRSVSNLGSPGTGWTEKAFVSVRPEGSTPTVAVAAAWSLPDPLPGLLVQVAILSSVYSAQARAPRRAAPLPAGGLRAPRKTPARRRAARPCRRG